jgi:hypothetical protein
MTVLRLSIPIIAMFILTSSILAQETPEVGRVRLSRFGDLLREHNLELTEPALIRALKNADSEVRFLAAMKLQEDKAVDATPAIREALAVEKVPRTRVNMALALGLLGDSIGKTELGKICADRGP